MPETTTSNRDRKVWDDLRKENRARDRKLNKIETHEYSLIRMINNSPNDIFVDAEAITGTYTTASARGAYNVPDNATGIFLTVWFTQSATTKELWLCSSDDTPSTGSQKIVWAADVDADRSIMSSFAMVKLGRDGAIKIGVSVGALTVSANIVGYWL